MLEDSERMLQNEMGKSLCATLVAAVELFSVLDEIWRGLVSGGWNSQNNSGSRRRRDELESRSHEQLWLSSRKRSQMSDEADACRSDEATHCASEGPPELRAKCGSSCELA